MRRSGSGGEAGGLAQVLGRTPRGHDILFQLVTKLPVIHGANAVGGGALGLLWGALVVFVVVWALRKFDILLTPETVEQSRLLRFFAEHSPLD